MNYLPFLDSFIKMFFQKPAKKNPASNPGIELEITGRSGYTILYDGPKTTRFYMELGGGNCLYYLVIPSVGEWENQTAYTLAERDGILRFVGESSLIKQKFPPGSFFIIEEKHMVFYKKA